MSDKISFNTAVQICDVLGKFAEVRSGSKPNKDFIMIVKKVDGRETLQLTQISQMNWLQRLVRWLGFGQATLKRVNEYFNTHSPYLPRRFSDLQSPTMPEILKGHYHQEAIQEVLALKKERLKQMRDDRFRGFEIFKQCLVHHNAIRRSKVYFSAEEGEKINLLSRSYTTGGILPEGAQPMGLLTEGNISKIFKKYHAPVLDPKKFGYEKPCCLRKEVIKDKNALGFCYEYGLGVDKDQDKALMLYKEAIQAPQAERVILGIPCPPPAHPYYAHYNLGRLYLQKNERQLATDAFNKAEKILRDLLTVGNDRLAMLAANKVKANAPGAPAEVKHNLIQAEERVKADMKICNKALSQIQKAKNN